MVHLFAFHFWWYSIFFLVLFIDMKYLPNPTAYPRQERKKSQWLPHISLSGSLIQRNEQATPRNSLFQMIRSEQNKIGTKFKPSILYWSLRKCPQINLFFLFRFWSGTLPIIHFCDTVCMYCQSLHDAVAWFSILFNLYIVQIYL